MTSIAWRAIGAEVAAFLLAACCAGCDAPGTLLCDACAAELVARPRRHRTPDGLPVWAALEYQGVAARCIRRLKEEGETALAGRFGAALRQAAERAVADAAADALRSGEVPRLVPVPTTRPAFRRRGYRVPEVVLRRGGLQPSRLLVAARAPADQRGLSRADRERNVRGSMRAVRAGAGEAVLLVDDVVTTGATFDEAARTMRRAGFRVLAGVAVAATPRRFRHAAGTSRRGGDIP